MNKALFAKRALVFKALAHPTRLFIIDKLSDGERCVCEFVNEIKADFSTVSKHLTVLKNAGLISDEKRGQQVFYRLRMQCVTSFNRCVDHFHAQSDGRIETCQIHNLQEEQS